MNYSLWGQECERGEAAPWSCCRGAFITSRLFKALSSQVQRKEANRKTWFSTSGVANGRNQPDIPYVIININYMYGEALGEKLQY